MNNFIWMLLVTLFFHCLSDNFYKLQPITMQFRLFTLWSNHRGHNYTICTLFTVDAVSSGCCLHTSEIFWDSLSDMWQLFKICPYNMLESNPQHTLSIRRDKFHRNRSATATLLRCLSIANLFELIQTENMSIRSKRIYVLQWLTCADHWFWYLFCTPTIVCHKIIHNQSGKTVFYRSYHRCNTSKNTTMPTTQHTTISLVDCVPQYLFTKASKAARYHQRVCNDNILCVLYF